MVILRDFGEDAACGAPGLFSLRGLNGFVSDSKLEELKNVVEKFGKPQFRQTQETLEFPSNKKTTDLEITSDMTAGVYWRVYTYVSGRQQAPEAASRGQRKSCSVQPSGMENAAATITASSTHPGCSTEKALLNSEEEPSGVPAAAAWCADSVNPSGQWLQGKGEIAVSD
ncbi:hypothetical protein Bbelb_374330 [Branchiostoma belcheri]|nr:hypothetical protein Bbelb_374330 [Branchiostoma belcheri]